MPRIAVSASQNAGKTVFIEDFIKEYPMYKKSGNSYRDYIESENLKLNKEGDEKSQEFILNKLIDEVMKYKKTDYVIHDRCPLDNLVYTLWLKYKKPNSISDSFVRKSFDLVRESMAFIDLIFYIPILDKYPVQIEEKKFREIDETYRKEIDNIFRSIYDSYINKEPIVFPFNSKIGSPAIIEIFGSREERIKMCNLYINKNGNFYGTEDSLI